MPEGRIHININTVKCKHPDLSSYDWFGWRKCKDCGMWTTIRDGKKIETFERPDYSQ